MSGSMHHRQQLQRIIPHTFEGCPTGLYPVRCIDVTILYCWHLTSSDSELFLLSINGTGSSIRSRTPNGHLQQPQRQKKKHSSKYNIRIVCCSVSLLPLLPPSHNSILFSPIWTVASTKDKPSVSGAILGSGRSWRLEYVCEGQNINLASFVLEKTERRADIHIPGHFLSKCQSTAVLQRSRTWAALDQLDQNVRSKVLAKPHICAPTRYRHHIQYILQNSLEPWSEVNVTSMWGRSSEGLLDGTMEASRWLLHCTTLDFVADSIVTILDTHHRKIADGPLVPASAVGSMLRVTKL
ncbi:hypothetical protein VFPPC_18155 [Pochonia chlamydosporia 170]|uniref:Uncharacterized protein n=1 Tax=Pochonia chlamydosporia 170 TaxID=1380566 RepID=A0A219ASQ8_METCM|nr:hypothetical protein VFPPC_18155 [Pochonia chlamydosporia 170]OWT43642.1 hypothetical protein VFPPC_18155 [Pochonia chlamydosporia 170]